MHFVIFTGGALKRGRSVEKALKSFDKIIAVDSGASYCHKLQLIPDLVVGDFDSIDKKTLKTLEKKGVPMLRFPREKDETDTEIAINTAIKQGATKISVIAGIFGERTDHMLANVLLPILYKIPVYFVDGKTTLWLAKGPKSEKITGVKNDLLSLIPLSKNVGGITTKGLKYSLKNGALFLGKTRGISNVFVKDEAEVIFSKGVLLLVHTAFA